MDPPQFRQKKETLDLSRFVFFVAGKGLSRPLHFVSDDVPGEVFEASFEERPGQIGPNRETVRNIRKIFREQLPGMFALLLLCDAGHRHDPQNQSLLTNILTAVAEQRRGAHPILVLVVLTKAGSLPWTEQVRLNDEIHGAHGLLKTFRHIYRWCDVVACESLADLEKVTANGETTYELPAEPVPGGGGIAAWVARPYEAMLRIPQMWLHFRAVQRWTRVGLAASAAALAVAGWLGATYWLDTRQLHEAVQIASAHNTERLEKLEAYLTRVPTLWLPQFHQEQARQEWYGAWTNSLVQLLSGDAASLSNRLAEADRSWRSEVLKNFGSDWDKFRKQLIPDPVRYEMALDDWTAQVYADFDKRIESFSLARWKALPNSAQLAQDRKDQLVANHQVELNRVLPLESCFNSATNLDALASCEPATVAVWSSLKFADVRGRWKSVVNSMCSKLGVVDTESQPQATHDFIARLKNDLYLMRVLPNLPAYAAVPEIFAKVTGALEGLKTRDVELTNKYQQSLKRSRAEALEICQQAIREMKDSPQRTAWIKRKASLAAQTGASS